MKYIKTILPLALCLCLIFSNTAFAVGDTGFTENGLKNYTAVNTVYTMDFTKTPKDYAAGEGWGFYNIANAYVADETLKCKALSSFSFYTQKLPGNDYALEKAEITFAMQLKSGTVTLALRLLSASDTVSDSGLWLTLTPGEDIKVTVEGKSFTVPTSVDFTAAHSYKISEEFDRITISADGAAFFTFDYGYTDYSYKLSGSSGIIGEGTYDTLPYNGYFKLTAARAVGYFDDVSYSHAVVTSNKVTGGDVNTGYYTATDDLDRTVGATADSKTDNGDKYVGLFYFINHSADTTGGKAYDTTRIYLEDGLEALKSLLSSIKGRNGVWWAEPFFGYYTSDDEWVFRKHAMMFDAAGVDFIFLDVSNAAYYEGSVKCLFNTWLEMRKEGLNTPQICFMYGDMPATLLQGLYTQMDYIYNNEEYQQLLFKWNGKPLVLGNNDTPNGSTWTISGSVTQTKKDYKNILSANEGLNEFYKNEYQSVLETLTVRKCWAWQAGTYNGYWDWLQATPQALGTDFDGNPEQISVSLGQHAHTNTGRSWVGSDTNYDKGKDFGFTLGTAKYGYHFAEQFDYALTQDVDVVMITGWNEWYAGVSEVGSENQTTGSTPTPYYTLIDQFTPEYSRDAEPMKIRDGVGFGDNYYYQMCSYIRKFKGYEKVSAIPAGTVDSNTGFAVYNDEEAVFEDYANDTAFRNEISFGGKYTYINGTGRNDIVSSSVVQTQDNIFVSAKTAAELVKADDKYFMNLYIDIDADNSTGWEGYDYLINRSRDGETVSVEKFKDGKWELETIGQADYVINGDVITIKLSKSMLSVKDGVSFDFKWTDNCAAEGDVMRFMDLGDAAPNDRFNFRYVFSSYAESVAVPTTEQQTSSDTTSANQPGYTSSQKLTVYILTAAVTLCAVVLFVYATTKKKR